MGQHPGRLHNQEPQDDKNAGYVTAGNSRQRSERELEAMSEACEKSGKSMALLTMGMGKGTWHLQ